MNRNLWPYYVSRGILSLAFGMLFYFTGSALWFSILIGAASLVFFLWAPRSGRYSVHPELGMTALRRMNAPNDQRQRRAKRICRRNDQPAGAVLYLMQPAGGIPTAVIKWILVVAPSHILYRTSGIANQPGNQPATRE